MGIIPLMSEQFKERLESRMKEQGFNMKSLSKAAGLGETTVRDILKRDRSPSLETVGPIASALRVSVGWLLTGSGDPGNAEPIDIPRAARRIRKVPILGYVGGGAEVFYPEGDASPIDEIEVLGATDDVEAVIIRGSSMEPVYRDRDIIVYRRATLPARDLFGEECVIRLADGRTFVKELQPGSEPTLFTLVSRNPAVPPITDVSIEWAVPIAHRLTKWRL